MPKYKKALIIDDDELFTIVVKENMKIVDFADEIIVFPDGEDAIKYLRTEKIDLFPDFILLDISMNYMDAWEFLEELQKMNMISKVDIHISSSSINPRDLERAKTNSLVQSFISKPVSIELLSRLKNYEK